ncbi:hypothetical protein NQZ79_g2729 [Umbelopsis isabellina]|nr:hypothetical protein NQZ79_g2729 [Umbelopsis isabellina]
MLSDRIGRRPVILSGLMGTMISIFLFGLSKSFAWAILSRSLCGILNGNVGVLKYTQSMIAEITVESSEADRARAFSLLPLMFGLGSIIGPILGGFLADPVKNYPSIFGNLGIVTEFLTSYRYFLPSLVATSICFCGWVFGQLYLEETLNGKRPQDKKAQKEEEERLLANARANYSTFSDNESSSGAVSPTPTIHEAPHKPTFREAITPPVIAASISFGLVALHGVFYDGKLLFNSEQCINIYYVADYFFAIISELYSLWLSTSREHGGMGFISKEIGLSMSIVGFFTLFVQLVLWPRLAGRFGVLRLFRICLACFAVVDLLQSFIRYLYHVPTLDGTTETKQWVWVGLMCCLAMKTICSTISFTSVFVLVSYSAPRMDTLGAVNGFSQCVASGCRATGPAICGILWDYSNHAGWISKRLRPHVSFIVLSMLAVIAFLSSLRLNPEHIRPPTKPISTQADEEESITTK